MFYSLLPAPNPIIEASDCEFNLKYQSIYTRFLASEQKKKDVYDENCQNNMWHYFEENRKLLTYQRFDNYPWSMIPLNNQRFAASYFFDARKLLSLDFKPQDFHKVLNKHLYPQTMKYKESQMILGQDQKNYKGLKFDSNFESGNLFTAYRIHANEYDLMMQNDSNTKGNTQWFYFSVEGMSRNQVVTFNIINFVKCDSLFNYGQRPVVFSRKDKKWVKSCYDIAYFRNKFKRENSNSKTYYSLTFTYKFEHSNDKVYFAQCYPYSYTDLQNFLQSTNKLVRQHELCKTITKQICPYLRVGTGEKKIVIMARQHPGETPSSYAVEGFITMLTSECFEAHCLREHCSFFIIPMVNPDGVIHGNYRTNLHGIDLNRIWSNPHKELHDSVHYVKEFIRTIQPALLIDIHGHSKKHGAFFYANNSSEEQKLLPYITSIISKMVNYGSCSFSVHESKKHTARVALQQLVSGYTYTFEISFHAYKENNHIVEFTQQLYRSVGSDLVLAIYKYLESHVQSQCKFQKTLSQQQNKRIDQLLQQELHLENGDELDSGSDSNPEEDALQEQEQYSIVEPKRVVKFVIKQTPLSKKIKMDRQTQTEISYYQNLLLDEKVLQSIDEQMKSYRKPNPLEEFNFMQTTPITSGTTRSSQTDISLQQILGKMQIYHVRLTNKYEYISKRTQMVQSNNENPQKPLVILLKNPYSKSMERRRASSNSKQQYSIQATPERRSQQQQRQNTMSPMMNLFQDGTFEKIANISRMRFKQKTSINQIFNM